MQVRRVVTAIDADGRSVFASDEPAPSFRPGAMPALEFFKLWGTSGADTTVDAPSDYERYWPEPGGTRLLLVRWAPESDTPEVVGDPAALRAETDRELAGLMDAFEADSPMHTSDSIDYGVVLEGEMWLELDDGATVQLSPGACVVQRGTRHAWSNRGTEPALMLFVLVGARRAG
jgi:mannose-6-phosphate isomerase-like protein (cupin superfamily)